MNHRVWVIGGTQESRWLVEKLLSHLQGTVRSSWLLVSVTTDTAKRLYPENPAVNLWVGKLTPDRADTFIAANNIGAILDASHPFASNISQLAIALAHRHGLPYLRYERPAISPGPEDAWLDTRGRPGNVCLKHLPDLFTGGYLKQERTLLLLGYRWLPGFALWQSQSILFVRILPSQSALAASLNAGFTSDRIIALRPPISASLEKALWQQWQITQVVTKASGQAGGEDHKQAIAAEQGVRLIRLVRPAVSYPAQTSCLDTAVRFVLQQHYP